jgi:2-aminoadipate transaminase
VFRRACERHLGELARWSEPSAGMFFWLELNDANVDSRDLIMTKAIEAKILMVPGRAFEIAERAGARYVRASFSTMGDAEIDSALERFARLLREM